MRSVLTARGVIACALCLTTVAGGQTTKPPKPPTATVPPPSGAVPSSSTTGIARLIVPDPMTGDQIIAGWVLLHEPAGAPVTIQLSSSNRAVAQVPRSVTVASGKQDASFPVTASPVYVGTLVTISARDPAGGTATNKLTVVPPKLTHLDCTASTTPSGTTIACIVGLNGSVVSGPASLGARVKLSVVQHYPQTYRAPTEVTIPPGERTAPFAFFIHRTTHAPQVTLSAFFTV